MGKADKRVLQETDKKTQLIGSVGTLKLSFLPSASCLWEKHPHELIVSTRALFLLLKQSFYDQRFLRTYITSFSLFSHHSKPFLCFTQVSAFTYSTKGDISLKLAGRGEKKQTNHQVNANMAFQTTALLIRYLFQYGINPAAYCEFCRNLKGRPPLIGWLQVNSPLSTPAVYI